MQLKLYSLKNDLLELDIETVRPEINIAEIFFEGAWHPWHAAWQILRVKDFREDFQTVYEKLIAYYKAEKASCTVEGGAVCRLPGYALLTTEYDEWRLHNCKISECRIDENHQNIALGLWYDGVCYKALGVPNEN